MSFRTIAFLPMAERTAEMCESACAKNGLMLKFVPKALRTAELCRLAVKENGLALSSVPMKERTEELCWLAISGRVTVQEILPAIPPSLQAKFRLLA